MHHFSANCSFYKISPNISPSSFAFHIQLLHGQFDFFLRGGKGGLDFHALFADQIIFFLRVNTKKNYLKKYFSNWTKCLPGQKICFTQDASQIIFLTKIRANFFSKKSQQKKSNGPCLKIWGNQSGKQGMALYIRLRILLA